MSTNAPQAVLAEAETLLAGRDLERALQRLHHAQHLGADADIIAGNFWLIHMLFGDFEQAWRQSDALRSRGAPDPHRFWTGEAIADKRIIVRCLHGFGDAVQMLRYAPQLQRLAAHVIYELPPRLYPLGRYFDGVDEIITWGEQAPADPSNYDLQLEVMELPYFFRTSLAQLPIATRYLQPPQIDATDPQKLRIGVVWSAGSWNPARSIPIQLLEPLFATCRFEFINLQGQGSAHEAGQFNLPAPEDGILPLAQAIAQLDLVLAVDTLAAHLAGALAVPCWLLLQHAADWRWLHGRTDSPWYPSLTLFRQPTPGNWAAVIAQVQQRLATLKP